MILSSLSSSSVGQFGETSIISTDIRADGSKMSDGSVLGLLYFTREVDALYGLLTSEEESRECKALEISICEGDVAVVGNPRLLLTVAPLS